MSVTGAFTIAAGFGLPLPRRQGQRRPAPFSLRLTEAERHRLTAEAAGVPLGAYIKAKALGDARPFRERRTGLAVEDRKALGQALALLGQSRLASSLARLAWAASSGSLALTAETESSLSAALHDIRAIRRLLLSALGLKPEVSP